MIRSWGRTALVAACVAAFASGMAIAADAPAAPAATVAAPASIPVADFFRKPQFLNPALSPSGRYLAAIAPVPSTQRLGVVVVDLEDSSKAKLVAHFDDSDVGLVMWANEDRLLMSLFDRESTAIQEARQQRATFYTVDREGRQLPQMVSGSSVRSGTGHFLMRHDGAGYRLDRLLRDGSSDIIVSEVHWDNKGEPDAMVPKRIGVESFRARTLVEHPPEHVMEWGYDLEGVPRLAFALQDGKQRVYSLAKGTSDWKLEGEFPIVTDVSVSAIDDDGNAYMALRMPGEDTSSLVRFNLAKGIGSAQPLVSLKGYDFDGSVLLDDAGHLVGIRYLSDARGSVWFDPVMKKAQERVDAQLPGTINQIDCGRCTHPARVLVNAYSDRQPAVHYVYDVAHDKLQLVGSALPWIDRRQMATQDQVLVTARDGLQVPVLVTRPKGQKQPAPAVVLVHGGPYLRGSEWGWSAASQFLASRGYVVIEPEFRGSKGFGERLYKAGWKQWGLAMQDDIADATLWAGKQGLADPKRVCIAGASYGGYATLMGLVRYPDLYRCGVEWAGVTDINFLYEFGWSDMSSIWEAEGLPVLVGDRKADAAQFEATSPVRQAARITRPLLMAHGTEDRRVPFQHFQEMRDALSRTNANVETIVYPGEGHGWNSQDNNIDFWTRVQAFLDKQLKSGS